MKKFVILLVVISLLSACKDDKGNKKADYREKDDYGSTDNDRKDDPKTTGTKNGTWSASDKKSFDEKCLETVDNDREKAKVFCPCLFEKLSARYSSMQEIDEKSTEAEGKRLATACLEELGITTGESSNKIGTADNLGRGSWPASEVKGYVTSCVREAIKAGKDKYTAQSYCECMQVKMEKQFPDINEAARLSKEEIMELSRKLAPGCLTEH